MLHLLYGQHSRMSVGMTVVRGPDWKWGNQDGDPPGTHCMWDQLYLSFEKDTVYFLFESYLSLNLDASRDELLPYSIALVRYVTYL